MTASLHSYRFYIVRNDSFVGRQDFDAADDAAALEEARRRVAEDGGELWCGSRKVAFVSPTRAR